MGLTKFLEKKFGGSEDNPKKSYEKAQELRQRQEEYEAEKKGYAEERVKRAREKGKQRARGSGGFGGGMFSGLAQVGEFGAGMSKASGVRSDMDFMGFTRPKPKPSTSKKQVVVVKVVGAKGAAKETERKKHHVERRHPFEL